MFKKNNEKTTSKLRNTIALKRNVYALILSVIFIVSVIAIIALSTYVAGAYPLDIDLTTDKQHSISGQNFDYIKDVEEKINIYVTLTEEGYNCQTGTTYDLGYLVARNQFVDYNSENVAYYVQTVELLKKYQSYNDNITVTFVDIYDAKAREITDNFDDYSWEAGDILVESTFNLNGKDVTRRTVVPFLETYTLEDVSGMAEQIMTNQSYYMMYGSYATYGQGYGYAITENKIENMISSAIYKVTSPSTPVFLVPTALSDSDSISEVLENTLQVNNFKVEYSDKMLSVLLNEENHDKYAGIILSNCKSDITESERELIEKFLNNNGKKGKSLFYFAGVNTYKLTNLKGLLGDWGIGFGEGILYETNTNFHASNDPTMIILESTGSDHTKTSDTLGKYYAGSNLVKMEILWPSNSTATYARNVESVMATASLGLTTVMPLDKNIENWKPAGDAALDKYITGVVSCDEGKSDNKFVESYVVAYASADLIKEEFSADSFGNVNLVLDTFNVASGNADTPFAFVPKTIETVNYTANVTEGKTLAIRIIFVAIVPVLVICSGVFVWIRRKRK